MTETKTTFTPGPWMFAEGNPRVFTPDGSDDVAFATASFERGRTYGEMVANARLIAAAPDMYAAIQEYLRFYDAYDGSADSYVAMNDAVEALRAALARANGEG